MPEDTHMPAFPRSSITGVILSGGQGRRVQSADKGLLAFGGKPLIEQVIAALQPQVGTIVINANRNHASYRIYGYPVIADCDDTYAGPLAGMESGMREATTPYILTVPCDAPRIPAQLAEGLYRSLSTQQADMAVAHDGTRIQPVFALLRCALLPALQDYLVRGERRAEAWAAAQTAAAADFSAQPDAFMNLNTPADFGMPANDTEGRTAQPCQTT